MLHNTNKFHNTTKSTCVLLSERRCTMIGRNYFQLTEVPNCFNDIIILTLNLICNIVFICVLLM